MVPICRRRYAVPLRVLHHPLTKCCFVAILFLQEFFPHLVFWLRIPIIPNQGSSLALFCYLSIVPQQGSIFRLQDPARLFATCRKISTLLFDNARREFQARICAISVCGFIVRVKNAFCAFHIACRCDCCHNINKQLAVQIIPASFFDSKSSYSHIVFASGTLSPIPKSKNRISIIKCYTTLILFHRLNLAQPNETVAQRPINTDFIHQGAKPCASFNCRINIARNATFSIYKGHSQNQDKF